MKTRLILVTGANGYIGRRLIPRLLEAGYRVRCLVREPESVAGCAWTSRVELFPGELVSGAALDRALAGVSAAYYLVHSMASGPGYHARDLAAARCFATAARQAGVERIVYLGGLANPADDIAWHMRSRMLTGEALRETGVPVTEFRAGVIVGPGSISFEMIRWLTEQLPVLVGPSWLRNRVQPIASTDVLSYLLAALETPASRGRILEIGGPDGMTYLEAMLAYARIRGLRRRALLVPVLPVRLLAFMVGKLTPVPGSIAAPLIDGLRSDSLVRDDAALRIFPGIRPTGYAQAVKEALADLRPDRLEPVWVAGANSGRMVKQEGFLIDYRQTGLEVPPEAAYRSFLQLGGRQGWLFLDWLWRLRGLLDRLAGGPGMRGRTDEQALDVGEVVDFYRVEAHEPGRLLRLRAELKAPGLGWMEWRARSDGRQGSRLSQTAFFAPRGVPGYLYWYLLHPLHGLVFAGLLRRLARRAEEIWKNQAASGGL